MSGVRLCVRLCVRVYVHLDLTGNVQGRQCVGVHVLVRTCSDPRVSRKGITNHHKVLSTFQELGVRAVLLHPPSLEEAPNLGSEHRSHQSNNLRTHLRHERAEPQRRLPDGRDR